MNEKCVSALEFSTMIPNPSSVSGGRTMGKIAAQSSASDLDRPADPLSAKAGHVGRMRVRACPPGVAAEATGVPLHDPRTSCLAALRARRLSGPDAAASSGLVGSSIRAGLARSATFTSWLPGSATTSSTRRGMQR